MPNDYWTAETVEDYMRCKVINFPIGVHNEAMRRDAFRSATFLITWRVLFFLHWLFLIQGVSFMIHLFINYMPIHVNLTLFNIVPTYFLSWFYSFN